MPRSKASKASKAAPVGEPKPTVVCQAPDCSVKFTPKRSTARFHTATCQKRAARARRAAEAAAEIDRKSETEDNAGTTCAEHGLVKATRLELEKAKAIDTVDGQIALQIARKLTDPDVSGFSALSKELRATLAAATGAKPSPAGETEPDPTEDDEVAKARRARDEARQAAGLT